MPLATRFDTPGSLRDLPAGSPFHDNRHAYLACRQVARTPGSGGGEFYDPSEENVDQLVERSLVWMGFPRRVLVYGNRDDRAAAFAAGEDREVQGEYLEWRVTRNRAGKITKVVFVTESPEHSGNTSRTPPTLMCYQRACTILLPRPLIAQCRLHPRNLELRST